MPTECTSRDLVFQPLGPRAVVGRFDGGTISSDGGCLLLGEAERLTGALRQLAACFTDHRDADAIEHTVAQLVAQRVYGLALGYEDLNDHDTLRLDPLLATLVGKADPTGAGRPRRRDRGKALAGKSTLNRLELTPPDATAGSRYQKVVARPEAIERLFVELFLQAHHVPPAQIVLDLDATDDPLHGHQEGRFFHGYYKEFCYLPLYVFCGEHLLAAKLRTADNDASHGTVAELERIIPQVRAAWPAVRILVRGDSGFCREEIMAWCEAHGVDYLFGLARNSRLVEALGPALADAHARYLQTGVGRPRLRRLRLPDAGQLGPGAAGRRQGGVPAQGAQPALRRDLAERRRAGGAGAVRGRLLRPRRHGEPDQGAAVDAVRRPHQHGLAALQPVAAVVLRGGVRAGAGAAPPGPGRHGDGPGAVRLDPAVAIQDRGLGARHGP